MFANTTSNANGLFDMFDVSATCSGNQSGSNMFFTRLHWIWSLRAVANAPRPVGQSLLHNLDSVSHIAEPHIVVAVSRLVLAAIRDAHTPLRAPCTPIPPAQGLQDCRWHWRYLSGHRPRFSTTRHWQTTPICLTITQCVPGTATVTTYFSPILLTTPVSASS